jgi:hypothetical protein
MQSDAAHLNNNNKKKKNTWASKIEKLKKQKVQNSMNISDYRLDTSEEKINELEEILVILLDQGKSHFLGL